MAIRHKNEGMKKLFWFLGFCVLSGTVLHIIDQWKGNYMFSFYVLMLKVIVMLLFGNVIPALVYLISIMAKKRIDTSTYCFIGYFIVIVVSILSGLAQISYNSMKP
jgi:hypothetical protein